MDIYDVETGETIKELQRSKEIIKNMKNPKNLTRKQKMLLSKKGFNPSDYKFIKTKEDKHIFYNLKTNQEEPIDIC